MQNKKAFTLVELIVVITILAILGTIAFLSFQGYSKSSRDSVRVADINNIKKALELFQLQTGKLPLPDDGVAMTFSGATVWTQGTFGDDVLQKTQKLSKLPVDPLSEVEYTYSVTNTQKEYSIGAILEGDETAGTINGVFAAGSVGATAYVKGNYNGLIVKTSTGGITYILAIPSIISRDTLETNVVNLVTSNELVFNGYANLPSSYVNTTFNVEGGVINNQTQIEIYSGTGMLEQSGLVAFIQELENAYSGTILADTGYIDRVIAANTLGDTNTINKLGAELLNTSLKTDIQVKEVAYSCATNPGNANTTYVEGAPTIENQAWQNTNNTNPCYYECSGGFTGENCEIAPLITSTECTNAGWIWISSTNDINIGNTKGSGFCISPRFGDWGDTDDGTDGISFNGWGASSYPRYSGWNTSSVTDSGNTFSAYGQNRSLNSSSTYNCRALGTANNDFVGTDSIVGRMTWLATTGNTHSNARSIEWVIGFTPPGTHAVPALFIADCIDGVKDLGGTMTYIHNDDSEVNISYSEYNQNISNDFDTIYEKRQRYLTAWTQKTGSHLPSAFSHISLGDNKYLGDGEYQVACENSASIQADATDSERIWLAGISSSEGAGSTYAQAILAMNNCTQKSAFYTGSRSGFMSARFVVRP